MSETGIRATEFSLSNASRPLLVLGPSLGTSVIALWEESAAVLVEHFDVVGWDLPGHGASLPIPESFDGQLTIADLAADVLQIVDRVQSVRGDSGAPFYYAGVSVAGCVGLQLSLDHPERIAAAALICTGAQIGDPGSWNARADLVSAAGASSQIGGSAQRWFAPGFMARNQSRSDTLLRSLQATDSFSYAAVCRALAEFDLRAELAHIRAKILVLSGAEDQAISAELHAELVDNLPAAESAWLSGVGHLAPAESPAEVAGILRASFSPDAERFWSASLPASENPSFAAGLAIRQEVLGVEHVAGAITSAAEFGADFQALITAYAWGEIWTRPGLDRRSRSMITLTALTANAHWEELAMHIKAARGNGLSWDEIKEVLLQSAIYCSVPNANNAFKIAGQIHQEEMQHREEMP